MKVFVIKMQKFHSIKFSITYFNLIFFCSIVLVSSSHQKEANSTYLVFASHADAAEFFDENAPDHNYTQPILVPIRESLIGPGPMGQKEWHWYRWTRSKYQLHKHHGHGQKKILNTTDVVIADTSSRNITQCQEEEDAFDSSLDDFPDDLFSKEQRQNGAVIFHIIGAIYFFSVSGIVIDRYFIPSVQCICEDLKITPDVGAAIFMATATAMPELFTNMISTFVTDSDMGIGNVIGSLMFNILGVTALSTLLIRAPIKMDWWPLTRDCTMFTFNVVFLLLFAWDGKIYLWEASVLLLLIILYYAVMFNSHRLSVFMKRKFEIEYRWCNRNNYDLDAEKNINYSSGTIEWVPAANVYTIKTDNQIRREKDSYEVSSGCKNHCNIAISSNNDIKNNNCIMTNTVNTKLEQVINAQTFEMSEDEKKIIELSLWKLPNDASTLLLLWWFYSWPIRFVLTITLPNPQTCRKMYVLTFILCIIWIGFVAYLIFWMLVVIGDTFGIAESILGLTVLAVGGCTPEMITGAIMARRGQAGTGIANSLGASSLAILLSLGLPWFIKVLFKVGHVSNPYVAVSQGDGVTFTIASLLFVPLILFLIISSFKFVLRRIASIFMITCYLLFVTFAVLVELDVLFPAADLC